jgi:hypothetical protein
MDCVEEGTELAVDALPVDELPVESTCDVAEFGVMLDSEFTTDGPDGASLITELILEISIKAQLMKNK